VPVALLVLAVNDGFATYLLIANLPRGEPLDLIQHAGVAPPLAKWKKFCARAGGSS
jgi:hypothetical protein